MSKITENYGVVNVRREKVSKMGLFSYNDEKCVDCKEHENLELCYGENCNNKMCQAHTYKINGTEYCKACYIKYSDEL
jgi:hypothetical protein